MTWDESKHPRVPAGSEEGGQCTAAQHVFGHFAKASALGKDAPSASLFAETLLEEPDIKPTKSYRTLVLVGQEDGEDIIKSEFSLLDSTDLFEGLGPAVEVSISTPKESRGKGYGTEILQRLFQVADKTGVPLLASADPFGNEPMSEKQLADWYLKIGFEKLDPKLDYTGKYLVYWPK